MTYGTILVDPPWAYAKVSSNAKLRGYADKAYPLLDTPELCRLPVEDLASENSVLILWATVAFYADAVDVMRAWGFTPKTSAVWGKVNTQGEVHRGGVGFWFRGAAEYVFIGTKGKVSPGRTGWAGLHLSQKLEHSVKPDWMHEYAETFLPGPYLELFARRERAGWTSVGNECPATQGQDVRDSLKNLTGVSA